MYVGTENGTLTAYKTKDGSIELTRGCFRGSIDEFVAKSQQVHDEIMQKKYQMLIDFVKMQLS